MLEPAYENLVLISSVTSEGSEEPVHLPNVATASTAHTHKQVY